MAVLNADDSRVSRFAEVSTLDARVTFGIDQEADFPSGGCRRLLVRPACAFGWLERRPAERDLVHGSGARFRAGTISRTSWRRIAAASVFDIAPESLVDAISQFRPRGMRGEVLETGGVCCFVNDCYNSNPRAVQEMLEVLRQTPAKRRIVVLGEKCVS